MERRRVIVTLAGGLAIAIALAACTDREPRSVALARNCAAPYYDYYYYPEKNVYFHVLTGFYYYYYDGHWGRSYVLPGDIRLNHRRPQTIVYRLEFPYDKNDDHRRQFGFPPDPRVLPVQASVGKSQPPPPSQVQYVAIACNPAAPPYDYYYYPEQNVYFHVSTGYYYYHHDGYWRHAFILPFHIIIDHRHRQTIVYRDKYPFEKNGDHRRQFGYQPDPRILPAQAGGGGNQGVGDPGQGKTQQAQPKAAHSTTPQTQPKPTTPKTAQMQPKPSTPKPSTPKPSTPKPAGKAPECKPGAGKGKSCK